LKKEHLEKLAQVFPTSLTHPDDRVFPLYLPEVKTILTSDQISEIVKLRYDNSVTDVDLPMFEKSFADPPIHGQRYALVSFVPSNGATPDKHKIHGFMKVRGVYYTENECKKAAEKLISESDTVHSIQTVYVGKPFPVCEETSNVLKNTSVEQVKTAANEAYDNFKREQSARETKNAETIKEREVELLNEGALENMNPMDRYIQLRVKRAHLIDTYRRYKEKYGDLPKKIRLAETEIETLESVPGNDTFREEALMRYKHARELSNPNGIEWEDPANSWVKYMMVDVNIDEL
jgi:hypothetical protein